MKRILLALIACLLLLPLTALAQEAQDITRECIVNKNAYNESKPDQVRDDDYTTWYKGQAVTIQAPEGKSIGALLIKWQVQPKAEVVVSTQNGDKWTEIYREKTNYAQQLIRFDEPQQVIRFKQQGANIEVNEVIVLTGGDIPAAIPQWKDAPEKVDLMLFSTHPDDEVLWFGGLLPYYAGEKDMEVLVINAVFGTYGRRLELLDALWTCGVDNYPIMFGFADNNSGSLKEIKNKWMGKAYHPDNGPIEVIRQYKPDVVVLQDINGEYGHKAHILFCQLARAGVESAALPGKHKESANKYGTWDVPKTYIHLYEENQLRMDWHQPLSAFGGKTGIEVAAEALECHRSQMDSNAAWQMSDVDGGEYDNALFGLWRTTVGPDVEKNDLFENIPAQ